MNPLAVLASLLTIGYAAWYILLCSFSPFGPCRRCQGTGHLPGRIIRRLGRPCPRCDGTGRRVRIGRRIAEYVRAEYREGTR
ncbi:MAG: hypothetical protein JXA67_10900 [Micromonosporaceae bacterium]|nr:hypothetical protein [Micromonosporaceae bacterium]